ncbi:CsoS2 family carboxysome shell protein [Aciditerrimonas ferrireducens]|uniref:CsoS2 family carboxysome shell protein n=1 Tax=Aciditerrimonas ferrireducens TaxID=667306 RepID=UPI002002BA61|nr:CsoS2 family carboxysome shell protein [Aciditerrimonas ferrireducens]MCK4177120.1 CsoS2 family carboxysome shell protein [Aciditerrimonas ferrireducens]
MATRRALAGRELALERRRALARNGSAAVVAVPDPPGEGCGCIHGDDRGEAQGTNGTSTVPEGRLRAMERRRERCERGRGEAPACRPRGRSRTPRPAPPKVAIGTTLAGAPVTGTAVDPTAVVTGSEAGVCQVVTGTEYAGAEQYEELCGEVPPAAAPKVGAATTAAGQEVTGTEVGRSPKVTGDEPGACARITGTQYVTSDLPEHLCGGGTPHKVSVMSTVRGRPVTGTVLEPNPKVTGAERGECQPVSGDQYVGPDQYEACDPADLEETAQRQWVREPGQGIVPSGTRADGGERLTGVHRGEDVVVSGTPYATVLSARRPELPGRLAGPTMDDHGESPVPLAPGRGGFSVHSPAALARTRRAVRITGTAYGGPAITGPVGRAEGLVSGTPEFRAREVLAGAVPGEVRRSSPITGEGAEDGVPVTGAAAWRPARAVTGTEGFSTRRNPTLRGPGPRGAMPGAHANRERERPEIPLSRITGSSGNTPGGAVITYSGGARG